MNKMQTVLPKMKVKVFVFIILLLILIISFVILSRNTPRANGNVDIGTTSFELFRQIVAYSYRDFVEEIDIKTKLNQTLEKMYNTLRYGGFNSKLYVITSNSLKQQINDFEKYYNLMFKEVKESQVDIESSLNSKKLNSSQKEIYKNFYNSIRTNEGFLKFTIQSYCSTLDNYTEYMGPKEYKTFKENIQGGNFSGVGIVMFRNNRESGEITIVEVIEDSPAYHVGIKAGDKIIKVDEKDITNLSLDTVQSMIRGPENTTVKLTIKRENKIMEFNIVRKIIHIKSIKHITKDGIDIYRIKTFSTGTSKEFLEAYKKSNSPNVFIIDLRNNGGGLLDEAINILSYFIGQNKIGVKLKTRGRSEQIFYTKYPKQIEYSKVVLLVNGYTASASEILVQSLKDYLKDDVIIIGSKTYGKNTVQTLYNLLDQGVLKLTIGKYFTISNRDIYKEKVSLDIEVNVNNFDQTKFYTEEDIQCNKAIEVLNRR
ncbi:MAG: S41 family peptidase [Candidatus Calescibacterium sp.]|nr:S41 family peptidase [Candidatus Calescibacterium sp.]MCX7972029.1 S41 family peptidase [bacterium]MDW8194687.1 S41 family peptidase [Candidatus Calescibacterium sp.]